MRPETPFIRQVGVAGEKVIASAEAMALQAVEQFVLYVAMLLHPESIVHAGAFARAQAVRVVCSSGCADYASGGREARRAGQDGSAARRR